jgi:ubiquinone/menaquinone biosynthesis C-methylase UbiE
VDLDEYRRTSHEVWERMSVGWDRQREWIWEASREVGERMVSALDPSPGQIVLELAAGTGETGFAAAALVGPEGKLISSDFAPGMVDAARRRVGELGLENVECRIIDAERIDLDGDSVDGALCRWGYMLMADPARALAETRRVLRARGGLVFSVWGSPERNPWAAIPGKVLVEGGHMPQPEPDAPGIFSMADPDRIHGLVQGAGFGSLEIEEVPMRWRFETGDDYWRFLNELAGAIALTIEGLSEEDREAVRAEIENRVAPLRSNGEYEMEGLCLNVTAS